MILEHVHVLQKILKQKVELHVFARNFQTNKTILYNYLHSIWLYKYIMKRKWNLPVITIS